MFLPHPKVGERQKSCSSNECQQKSTIHSQQEWQRKNPEYFHGRYPNTREWRKNNPNYQKEWRSQQKSMKKLPKKMHEIQD
ncbi:MAG: hypothetical protein Q7U04_11665 [Bacteriovorax sp.]|nr:hypothetical protein [Bacteriovorax sp.]